MTDAPRVNPDEWRWTYDEDLNWLQIQGVVAGGFSNVTVSARVYRMPDNAYIGHGFDTTMVGGIFDITIHDVAKPDDIRVVFACEHE